MTLDFLLYILFIPLRKSLFNKDGKGGMILE